MEMELYIGLILRMVGEIINLTCRRGDVTKAVSSLIESRRIRSWIMIGVGDMILLGDVLTSGYQHVENFPSSITNKIL